MNPLDTIKERLGIEAVIGGEYELQACGVGRYKAKAHESLSVNAVDQVWSWFSQSARPGQKVLGGDVFDWLAWRRHGRISRELEKAEWGELLREACARAGLDPDQVLARDVKSAEKARARRAKEDLLGRYLDVAVEGWTDEARASIRRIKPWLSDAVIERWRLGVAPRLEKLIKAGLSEEALVRVGLVKRNRKGEPYPHFRNCVVIPYFERGRVVYLSSRRLRDVGRDGEPLPKAKKALAMPRPSKVVRDGKTLWSGGMWQPMGFNLDALLDPRTREVGLVLVEGALDAIACTERGHPAIGVLRSTPSDELCARLRRAMAS